MAEPKRKNDDMPDFEAALKVVTPTYQVQKDINRWARIGGTYWIKKSDGWEARKVSEFDDEFGKDRRKEVKSYLNFYCEPDHVNHEKFKTTKDGILVNWYRPLPYEPKEGDWSAYKRVLEHFGTGEEYGYEFFMHWLWLKYTKPKLPLPFVLLVGGKGGGKSTWEPLCSSLFGDNFFGGFASDILLRNNIHTFGKIILHIREKTSNERFAEEEMNKLKARVNAPTLQFKALYANIVTGPNYAAGSLDSNNVDAPVSIESENRRFITFDVPKIPESKRYRGIFDELEKQAPAFAYHLINEFKHNEELGNFNNDLWFYEKYINSNASQRIQDRGKNKHEEEIYGRGEYLLDIIRSVKITRDTSFCIRQGDLVKMLKEQYGASNFSEAKQVLSAAGFEHNKNFRPGQYKKIVDSTGAITNFGKTNFSKGIGCYVITLEA